MSRGRCRWTRGRSRWCSIRCCTSLAANTKSLGRARRPREQRAMREDLLHYYERELAYVRRMGAEFAQRYPKIASRLQLEPNKCEDPHVERVIEAFAFLAARVHLKIDDDFPEVTES